MRQESNSPDADTKARLLRIWWGMGMGMGHEFGYLMDTRYFFGLITLRKEAS